MLNPIRVAEATERIVCKEGKRKYYGFRGALFYGGVATADCVGCCLRCVFCWAWKEVNFPDKFGRFYTPQKVATKLIRIAERRGFDRVRISGNEPTICREHLLRVIENVPERYLFILETNGILIGHDESYAKDLSRFKNLHVRVSLKGADEEDFSRLTGAKPEFFKLQLRALENLKRFGVSCHPAVMVSFSPPEKVERLKGRLSEISPEFHDIEEEVLILYPSVKERLERLGIEYFYAEPVGKIA